MGINETMEQIGAALFWIMFLVMLVLGMWGIIWLMLRPNQRDREKEIMRQAELKRAKKDLGL